MMYGLYSATEGDILVDGEVRAFHGPSDAIAAGIGMVHQHFMLVPVMSVAENVVLGVEPLKEKRTPWMFFGLVAATLGLLLTMVFNLFGVEEGIEGGMVALLAAFAGLAWILHKDALDIAESRSEVEEISAKYGLAVDPDALIEDLPVGLQQRVEIIKVLFREAEIIIFDEPTAVLTPQEVEEFFGIMRSLQADGKGVIFITHKLNEINEVCDRITVLRRGKVVGETTPAESTEQGLAEMMVGRPVDLQVHKADAKPGDVVLEVQHLTVDDDRGHPAVSDVSFSVRAGEIVGVAGIQGNGQTELVEAITGLRPGISGATILNGEDISQGTPRHVHDAGVAHIPEDRQRMGLVLPFTVTENVVLNTYHLEPFSNGTVMDWSASKAAAERLIEQYDVRTPSAEAPASTLSGGNQQKVIVAREFSRTAPLVVASQPTRGIDVGSIEYIHERIVEQRDNGAAILIVSTELDEIMALSDRILVMYEGRIVAETTPDDTTTTDLGLYMAGATA
ncbi:ABC transporter, ATP-binding protein (cluster 11, riboflavin/purine nucleoside/unknown) / ABC transporter, ATP-binding protein (cluster 11, riboflavin/purine nucleoside/unknown) [hydrothermal vent metagenome]|uniref:ABC transporter domain-containing protein n=1 Tax=hydrothermal vent metagenome TaxID=652676 RepID=A0A3B0SHK9_9ZZZZ